MAPTVLSCPRRGTQSTIEDLEDTSFAFDGSIGSLIQNAAHLAGAFRRAFAVVHTRALFLSWTMLPPMRRVEPLGNVA